MLGFAAGWAAVEVARTTPRPDAVRVPLRAAAKADASHADAGPVRLSADDFRRRPGERDDTPRLNRLLESVSACNGTYGPGGVRVELPPGDYYLSDTLTFEDLGSVYFRGAGTGTRFHCAAGNGKPCLVFAGTYRVTFEGATILNSSRASRGLLVTNPAPGGSGGWVSSACVFKDLHFTAEGGGDYDVCCAVDNTALGGPDANDEDHHFEGVTAGNYATAAFYQSGSNVHQIHYADCKAVGNSHSPPGKYGVLAAYSCYFTWERGYMNGHSEYDFNLADFNVGVRIRDFNGENSCGFVATGGPTGAPLPLTVEGGRWDGVPRAATAADAHAAVLIRNPGPVSIRGMRFVSLNGNWPLFSFGGFSPGSYTFEGNHVQNVRDPNARNQLWGVFPGSYFRSAGNVLQDATGAVTLSQ